MAIWTQILSWALICSLAQGFIVYTALWLILKLLPGSCAATKYKCSLAALSLLLLWFGLTLRQQLHYVAAGDAFPLSGLPVTGSAPLPGTFAGLTAALPPLPGLRALFPYLAAAYLAGLFFMLLRLSGGIRQLAQLRTKGLEIPDAALYESLQALKLRLQLKRRVRLLVSVRARVPMVIGFLKPVILLPAASVLNLSAAQLETILLHELAHIKRQDFLVNMLQTIVETILFFNPFVWLISSLVRREREYCCDDLVLAHTSERVSYARALTTLADLDSGALAVAASGRPGHLMLRIRRIVELKKSPFSYSRMAAALLILVLIIFTASRVSHSFAMVKSEFTGGPLLSGNTIDPAAANSEELLLVTQLRNDHLVDEAKGFIIEKKNDQLFIDYKVLPEHKARKYLALIKKKEMSIQVYPLQERIRRHPGSSLLQLSAPVQLSSPCVDYTPPKEGC